jgi:hypothetical protein
LKDTLVELDRTSFCREVSAVEVSAAHALRVIAAHAPQATTTGRERRVASIGGIQHRYGC